MEQLPYFPLYLVLITLLVIILFNKFVPKFMIFLEANFVLFSLTGKMNSKLIFLLVLAFVCYAHARSTKGKILIVYLLNQ